MNRRVLLIDADVAFRDTLTAELDRYRVAVTTEPDPERAIAAANAETPALIVLCIEEAEKKAGFRVFEKCKKGALSKIPIILVTATVPPESFVKHRGLKNHADDYIDKRTMSTHELVGKIDGLIGLGDPQEQELSIPIEDEIPMEIAEGDVVLDEVVGDDPATEFDHDMRTVGPDGGVSMDAVVDAETDAAFAAMVGAELGPAAAEPSSDEPGAPAEAEPEPDPVPEAILDGRGRGTTPPPFQADSVPGIIHDGGLEHDEPHEPEHPVAQVEAELQVAPQHFESSPAIPIGDDELLAVDDELPVEVETDLGAAQGDATLVHPATHDAHEPDAAQAQPQEAPRAQPKFIDSATVVEPGLAAEPIARPSSTTMHPLGGSNPAIDLGLDMVAQDADREQSGVYDRRTLRQIGELERQVAQLKTELDRARAAGEAAAKSAGRENQFLNLRESMLGKEKELKEAKTALVTRDQELAEAREKLRQAVHAKTTLESKNAELETRLVDDSGKSSQLAASAKTATSQLAQLRHELETATKAHATAETARANLERDLANERATGAASASEAERMLRVEREQLIQRHQSELAALRADAQSSQDVALTRRQQELETTHAGAISKSLEELRRTSAAEQQKAVAALERTHAGEMVALKADQAGELGRIRNELGAEVDRVKAALAAAEAAHRDALAAAAAAHRQALLDTAANQGGAIDELAAKHAAELAARDASHSQARDADAATHAAAVASLEAKRKADAIAHGEALDAQRARDAHAHADALKALEAQRTQDAAAHAEVLTALDGQRRQDSAEHAEAIAAAEAQRARDAAAHAEALAAADARHEADATGRADAIAAIEAQRRGDAIAHADAIVALKADLERAGASIEVKLGAAKRELEQVIAQHEQAHRDLDEQHRSAIASAAAAHQQELAKLTDEAKRTGETHRAALAAAQTTFDAELAKAHTAAARGLADHEAAALAANRTADDAIAKLHTERDAAARAHAAALAELDAKHARSLAAAQGDLQKQKSVADAEHAKALAAHQTEAEKARGTLVTEHARALKELGAERDEVKRGLSSARDSLKRSEGELASAVQSIADRNAELRSHAAAIAERDQRIAELRKEIESIEAENTSYQDQVLRAYQKIKTDEAMVARARKAMAIALTVLDDSGKPTTSS